MSALHPKSSYWLRNGVFDDLTSFADFEAKVCAVTEEKDRGDIFEIFVEGYLATQTITQSVQHWIVGSIPLPLRERYNLPRDATGIDGVYEVHDGSHIAYQVKFRQKPHLTFAEVAPFLGVTERFSDRVIFTNASALSDKAVTRTRWVSREVFSVLSAGALQSIEAWLKEKPLPVTRAKPDPRHQVQALENIKATLAAHDRATAVMACGTGKTLVALWAAEQQQPKTVLVLVPSLTLLQQTLRQWSEQSSWGQHFRYLCVCSDETVGLKDDAWNTDKTEVGFRVDTDPKVVRSFLESQTDEVKVIFSTYHSSPVVGEGAAGLTPIDLAIFDEAHKTTGHSGTAFTFALSDERLRIRKRLFLTATPRHIDIRHRDKEGEFRVQSMDDEAVYGPRAHTLSFGSAAKQGIICPYKVIISLIDKEAVSDFSRQHGITIVETDEIGTRWVANLVALAQAVEQTQARKIITFHSRVRLAQDFATAEPRGITHYLGGYDVRHVNGSQNSAVRSEIIQAFADAPRSLLTNARCLTEGIDIPAVDMVAFVDPRQSRIDITQAVGRAMRKPRGNSEKTAGYVVVPVFAGMGKEDNLDSAVKSAKFDVVADVLNALQEHDEELVDIIREIREQKGAGALFNPTRLSEKLEVIGPFVDLTRLTESIGLAIADHIGSNWDESFGMLKAFVDRTGHAKVANKYETPEGYRLGQWAAVQRTNRETMPTERKERLGALPSWSWQFRPDNWQEGFHHLEMFTREHGHSNAPKDFTDSEGYKVGFWIANQRSRRNITSPERKARLEALPGWTWNPHLNKWEIGFSHLELFADIKGHARPPQNYKTEDGYPLGTWVTTQRTSQEKLSPECRERLESLPGWIWNTVDHLWDIGIQYLKDFSTREGHCHVPAQYRAADGYRLGQWVSIRRLGREDLPPERRAQLEALPGWSWNPHLDKWETGFRLLQEFSAKEGHCLVPTLFRTADGYRLGSWVNTQRTTRSQMPAERRQRLDAIGFVWRVN